MNTGFPGYYALIYRVSDAAGNTAAQARLVTIYAFLDPEDPLFDEPVEEEDESVEEEPPVEEDEFAEKESLIEENESVAEEQPTHGQTPVNFDMSSRNSNEPPASSNELPADSSEPSTDSNALPGDSEESAEPEVWTTIFDEAEVPLAEKPEGAANRHFLYLAIVVVIAAAATVLVCQKRRRSSTKA